MARILGGATSASYDGLMADGPQYLRWSRTVPRIDGSAESHNAHEEIQSYKQGPSEETVLAEADLVHDSV